MNLLRLYVCVLVTGCYAPLKADAPATSGDSAKHSQKPVSDVPAAPLYIDGVLSLPSVTHPQLTTDVVLRPHQRMLPSDKNPAIPAERQRFEADGYGEIERVPGNPYQTRTLYPYAPPSPGPNAKRLVRFAHLADTQLADDESPARTAFIDTTGQTSGAYRPQEGHGCHVFSAAVRTINALHAKDSVDFVLMGGDNIDNSQQNELGWALDIFRGGKIDCDSGQDDDPTPGLNNDVKDPYISEGLLMPSKWVTGNHDILIQGNLSVIGSAFNQIVVGTQATLGTRDYRLPGAPVVADRPQVADPRRKLHERTELMQRVATDGDGHGLGMKQIQSGKAYYHFDVPNTPLRFVVLDTSSELGGADGVLLRADVAKFVKPALEEAKALGKYVVLASHHSLATLTTNGGAFGHEFGDDAITEREWRQMLLDYPVVLSMVGHTHAHRVRPIAEVPGHGFWELMTASLIDFPGQFRMVEIFDQDNGWLMIRATCVDYSGEGDPLAEQARELMFVDWATGWGLDGSGESTDLNVELWIEKPQVARP